MTPGDRRFGCVSVTGRRQGQVASRQSSVAQSPVAVAQSPVAQSATRSWSAARSSRR